MVGVVVGVAVGVVVAVAVVVVVVVGVGVVVGVAVAVGVVVGVAVAVVVGVGAAMTRPHLSRDESDTLQAAIHDAVRQRRELTNKALARRFGVSYSTVCKRVARARRKGLVP